MPADDRVLSVVRGWVQKAESDLNNAAIVLRAEDEGTADTVAFHAQQGVEKYLKALLAYRGIDFPKTHDIGQLDTARKRGGLMSWVPQSGITPCPVLSFCPARRRNPEGVQLG